MGIERQYGNQGTTHCKSGWCQGNAVSQQPHTQHWVNFLYLSSLKIFVYSFHADFHIGWSQNEFVISSLLFVFPHKILVSDTWYSGGR